MVFLKVQIICSYKFFDFKLKVLDHTINRTRNVRMLMTYIQHFRPFKGSFLCENAEIICMPFLSLMNLNLCFCCVIWIQGSWREKMLNYSCGRKGKFLPCFIVVILILTGKKKALMVLQWTMHSDITTYGQQNNIVVDFMWRPYLAY